MRGGGSGSGSMCYRRVVGKQDDIRRSKTEVFPAKFCDWWRWRRRWCKKGNAKREEWDSNPRSPEKNGKMTIDLPLYQMTSYVVTSLFYYLLGIRIIIEKEGAVPK